MRLSPILLASLLVLIGAGCTPSTQQPSSIPESSPNVSSPTTVDSSTIYTSFIINVHDWTQPDDSIATVNRIIDLHEKYNVPVDIYLDDGVDQAYEKNAPELFTRLAESPVVAVSWHIRPPTPYYSGFHEEYFANMSDSALYDSLLTYETHAIDPVSGKTTSEPGGYARATELIGYAPYVVAQAAGSSRLTQALADVYKDLGAQMTLRHGKSSAFGDTSNGLFLRPEDVEVKAYEKKSEIPVSDLFAEALSTHTDSAPTFVNFKWHENNFYSSGTSWAGIYIDGTATDKETGPALNPPYDLSKSSETQTDKTDEQERIQWERYEDMLKEIVANPELYTPVNARIMIDRLKS